MIRSRPTLAFALALALLLDATATRADAPPRTAPADSAVTFTLATPEITEFKLSNGVQVFHVLRPDLPIVAVHVASSRGSTSAEPGVAVLASEAAVSSAYDAYWLRNRRRFNQRGARLDSDSHRDVTSVSGETLSPNFPGARGRFHGGLERRLRRRRHHQRSETASGPCGGARPHGRPACPSLVRRSTRKLTRTPTPPTARQPTSTLSARATCAPSGKARSARPPSAYPSWEPSRSTRRGASVSAPSARSRFAPSQLLRQPVCRPSSAVWRSSLSIAPAPHRRASSSQAGLSNDAIPNGRRCTLRWFRSKARCSRAWSMATAPATRSPPASMTARQAPPFWLSADIETVEAPAAVRGGAGAIRRVRSGEFSEAGAARKALLVAIERPREFETSGRAAKFIATTVAQGLSISSPGGAASR